MTDPFTSAAWLFLTKKFGVFFSGFIGAIISLKFVQGLSIKTRIFTVLCGATLAHFTTAGIADYFEVSDYHETIGFLIGLFGLSLCAAIFKAFNDADIWGVIKAKFESWGEGK